MLQRNVLLLRALCGDLARSFSKVTGWRDVSGSVVAMERHETLEQVRAEETPISRRRATISSLELCFPFIAQNAAQRSGVSGRRIVHKRILWWSLQLLVRCCSSSSSPPPETLPSMGLP